MDSIVAEELSISRRRNVAMELIMLKGFVTLGELASTLGVSESTARRDLDALEEGGSVRRTHGGVVSLAEPPTSRLGYADRQATAVAEKQAIAAAVARRIPENQTVILDGGTTCCHVAEALTGRRLSVITNSVPIAALLGGDVGTEVTLIGGYLYPRTGVALGAMAEEMLGSLRGAQVVMSCAAANRDGVFNVNEMMAAVERRMIQVADETILAVDHTKFERRSIAPLCGWDDVDVLVTDAGIDEQTRQWLASLGPELVIAELPE